MTTDSRRRVLDMLAEGKISAAEAERLLEVLDREHQRGPDVQTLVEEGVHRATDVVSRVAERVSVEVEDAFDKPGDHHISRTFTVQDQPKIIVDNFNGRVEVVGGVPDNEVRVDAELRNPDRVDYSAVQDGNTIRVQARPRRRRSILGWINLSRGAHIKLNVPTRSDVEVSNSNGRVTVRDVTGAGWLQTSNGRITASGLEGNFRLTTSNSRISTDRLSGEFDLRSSNGRITVRRGIGEYRAESSNGQIRFEGELTAGGDNSFTTSNGGITVALGAEPSLRLSAETSNGSIRCDHEIMTRGTPTRRSLEGVIGDGEATLSVRTSNGSITVV